MTAPRKPKTPKVEQPQPDQPVDLGKFETTGETPPHSIFIKMISFEYERKINLETISKHRPYESASAKVSMYADISMDEQGDQYKLTNRELELQQLVRDRANAILQETVVAVRAADLSLKYSSIAIEKAVDGLIKALVGDVGDQDKIRAEFMENLKTAQAALQAQ